MIRMEKRENSPSKDHLPVFTCTSKIVPSSCQNFGISLEFDRKERSFEDIFYFRYSFFSSSSLVIKFQLIILIGKTFGANIRSVHDSLTLKRVGSRKPRELVQRSVTHKHTFWTKSQFHFS